MTTGIFGAQQGLGDCIGVGPHQSARAQFHATKVAHHRGQHALHILMAQHLQHGAACSAARLAVVVGRRLATGQQRPADMRSIRMLCLELHHPGLCLLASTHWLDAGDEPAFLDDEYVADRRRKREGHAPRITEGRRRTATIGA